VLELAGEGTDMVTSSVDWSLGADLENLVLTGSAVSGFGNELDNSIAGNASANVLDGGAGNDFLDGGTGIDTLTGGLGDDGYVVDSVLDRVIELAGEGTDTVTSSVDWSLGADLKNLVLAGSAVNGFGNELNNAITGNATANVLRGGIGDDTISGGAGADTLLGGIGDDLYVVTDAGDVITELAGEGLDSVRAEVDWTLSSEVENLTLVGVAVSGTGNTLANLMAGNTSGNLLTAGAGNDTIDGGSGTDTLIGGAGDDLYLVDNVGDVVTELSDEGVDTVRSTVDWTLSANTENLALLGVAINGTGNNLSNVITGNALANNLAGGAGDDTLSGGVGSDTMVGGQGNDIYFVDNLNDRVTEVIGEGLDSVYTSVNWLMPSGSEIENVILLAGASQVSGNEFGNSITGNASSNFLDGGAGADTLIGGIGDDSYVVDDVGDVVLELNGAGSDIIQAGLN
jgi:Ca2+-binding RTX toxin-like protein